jgi:DNA-binding XRE family transcriptional regulator
MVQELSGCKIANTCYIERRMRTCKHCNGSGFEPDHSATGNALRSQREGAGLSLREMAEAIGVSHSFLSQLENGHRTWRRSLARRYSQAIQKNLNKINKHYVGPLIT